MSGRSSAHRVRGRLVLHRGRRPSTRGCIRDRRRHLVSVAAEAEALESMRERSRNIWRSLPNSPKGGELMIDEPRYIIGATLVGLGATLLLDLWALLLRRGFDIPSLNYCLLGRWLPHMPGGTIVYRSLAAAQQKPHECTLGWVAHYLTGIAFALVFVLLGQEPGSSGRLSCRLWLSGLRPRWCPILSCSRRSGSALRPRRRRIPTGPD